MNAHDEHPFVTDYLRRFDTAAQTMPPARRLRLREDIEGHLHDAIPAGSTDADAAAAISEFGSPADILGQEIGNGDARNSLRSSRNKWAVAAIAIAIVIAVVLTLLLTRPSSSPAGPAEPAAETATSAINATPEGSARVKKGLAYFEYLAAIEKMAYPLPPGAEYPAGVPEATDPAPIEWEGLASNAVGSSIAHYTWLCAWETEYLDAFKRKNLERRAVAEVMINRWTETEYYATISDPDQAWIRNVTEPMSFGKTGGVSADRGQSCSAAGIYNVGN